MSAGGGPAPLSSKIELPAEFQEIIGEYKKAISAVKKELREVEKEAKDVLKTQGAVDIALEARANALRKVQAGLEDRLKAQEADRRAAIDAKEAKRQEEAEEKLQEEANKVQRARLDFAGKLGRQIASTAGVSLSMGPEAAAVLQTTAAIPGMAAQYGRTLKAMGMTKIGGALAEFGKAEGGVARALAGATPALGATLAIAAVAQQVYKAQTESITVQAEAMAAESDDLTRLTGGNIANRMLDFGNAARAQRISAEMRSAQQHGKSAVPIGFMDALANTLGYESAGQLASGERYRKYVTRLEEAREKFGATYDPMNQESVRKHALFLATNRLYTWGGMAEAIGATVTGQYSKFIKYNYEQALIEAADTDAKSRAVHRDMRQQDWANGPEGALRRVFENEQRRWLRAVEEDRASRFSSWSLQ